MNLILASIIPFIPISADICILEEAILLLSTLRSPLPSTVQNLFIPFSLEGG